MLIPRKTAPNRLHYCPPTKFRQRLSRLLSCPIFDWLLAIVLAFAFALPAVGPEVMFKSFLNTFLGLHGVHYKTLKTQGFTIRFYEAGATKDRTVVLLHGLGGNALYTWMRLMPTLAKNYHVLAPNLINAGIEQLNASTYTLAQEEELVVTLLDDRRIHQVDLVGLSVGGWLGMRLALDYPQKINSMVLIAPAGIHSKFPSLDEMGITPGAPISLWYGKLFHSPPPIPGFVLDIQTKFAASLYPKVKAVLHSLRATAQPLDDRLAEVTCPTLIIWGQDDQILPPEWGNFMVKQLPSGRLVFLPSCGHASVWDQSTRLRQTVQDFLATTD